MALDFKKLVDKARAKSKPAEPMPEPDGDYSCGDRAIAGVKHGDGEAFEQAIEDIVRRVLGK